MATCHLSGGDMTHHRWALPCQGVWHRVWPQVVLLRYVGCGAGYGTPRECTPLLVMSCFIATLLLAMSCSWHERAMLQLMYFKVLAAGTFSSKVTFDACILGLIVVIELIAR